jgi:hypothetical protein
MVEALIREWPQALLFCAAGLLLGVGYFAALRESLLLLVASRGRFAAAALTLVRLAAIGAFLLLAARRGAIPLLSGFAGFLSARALALHRVRPLVGAKGTVR